jgi:hypothetical protein
MFAQYSAKGALGPVRNQMEQSLVLKSVTLLAMLRQQGVIPEPGRRLQVSSCDTDGDGLDRLHGSVSSSTYHAGNAAKGSHEPGQRQAFAADSTDFSAC